MEHSSRHMLLQHTGGQFVHRSFTDTDFFHGSYGSNPAVYRLTPVGGDLGACG